MREAVDEVQGARPGALPRLYLVTDRRQAGGRGLAGVVAAALSGLPEGAAIVQLREKDLEARALLALARALMSVCRTRRCPLVVNDRIDVALAAGADGVHLPERGLSLADARALLAAGDSARAEADAHAAARAVIVGRSTHGIDAAERAAAGGADLVVVGPVWATPSKRGMGEPLGVEALARATRAVTAAAPGAAVFAIGGIDGPERARAARAAGAHGVAVIRAVMSARDPGAAAAALHGAVSAPVLAEINP